MRIVKNCVTISKNASVDDALEWAYDHCPSYITNDGYIDHEDGQACRYYFIFGDERDIISFSLRWS